MIDRLKSFFEQLSQAASWSDAERSCRADAMARFESKGFPTTKDEAWRYTPLRKWVTKDYRLSLSTPAEILEEDIKGLLVDDMLSYRLVFINGALNVELSDADIPGGVTVGCTSDLATYPKAWSEHLGTVINSEDNSLADLNRALASGGLLLHVPKGVKLDRPIQILYLNTGDEAEMRFTRSLVILEQGAEANLLERHHGMSGATTWSNSAEEAVIGDGATLQWVKIQHDDESSALTQHTSMKLGRDANAAVHTFSTSGKLIRNNLDFDLTAPGAEAWMYGLTISDGKSLVDHHTRVDHSAAHCQSHQNYKGLYGDASQGVFNGKIMVHVDAQKTEAYQQSDSLLLTEKAQVNAKPQLEIFADDVKCSHGCTVGQLNEDALFYLRARGIPEHQARAILMVGFAQEALGGLSNEHLKAKLNDLIAEKLQVKGVEAIELG